MTTSLPTATELLRSWDAARPRSLQREMGISSLGGCRRKAGYHLQGHAPDPDFSGDGGMEAIIGTSVHDALAAAARQSAMMPLHARAEALEVRFAGLKGHPDLFAEPVLRDYKTVGHTTQLDRLRTHGPWQNHLWQVNIYAAALILAGHTVTTIEIDYIARSTGEEYLWAGSFDLNHVRDAVSWLELVRATSAEYLSRDYRPGSPQCQHCPFKRRCWQDQAAAGRNLRTVLFAEDPDAAKWAVALEHAREARKEAELAEADARGALDALRTVERPGESQDVQIPGFEKAVRFTVSRGAERLDAERIYDDYARAGALPPKTRGEPRVNVSLVARE